MAKLYYRYRGDTFLTVVALLQVHADVLELSGGLPGIKDRGSHTYNRRRMRVSCCKPAARAG
jgi:hypothetical protein